MNERPDKTEAAPYYFRYIDRVPDGDVVASLESGETVEGRAAALLEIGAPVAISAVGPCVVVAASPRALRLETIVDAGHARIIIRPACRDQVDRLAGC